MIYEMIYNMIYNMTPFGEKFFLPKSAILVYARVG